MEIFLYSLFTGAYQLQSQGVCRIVLMDVRMVDTGLMCKCFSSINSLSSNLLIYYIKH